MTVCALCSAELMLVSMMHCCAWPYRRTNAPPPPPDKRPPLPDRQFLLEYTPLPPYKHVLFDVGLKGTVFQECQRSLYFV